jgi:hypothetical protein
MVTLTPLSDEERRRFWDHVIIAGPNDCWEYICADHNEYGHKRMWLHGRYEGVHRIAFYLFTGAPPSQEQEVMHTCDNPGCVNPLHLMIGTKIDNQLDKVQKGRHAVGSKNGAAVLTEEDVVSMRQLYSTGLYPMSKLAALFGISKSTVANAVSQKSKYWRHICQEQE